MRRVIRNNIYCFAATLILIGFFGVFGSFSISVSALGEHCPILSELNNNTIAINDVDRNAFYHNDILFYEPPDCIEKPVGTISGTGDFDAILKAKNADKSFFNGEGDVPSAHWSDNNLESLKVVLETYGDLAYQLGRAIGAPWIAILVQMRYEDPYSKCGANNFWGNGCPLSRAYVGGATIQGANLGEGFVQYGKTLTEFKLDGVNLWYAQALGIADPKEYLETLGPLWVQGDVNGAGYSTIEGEKASIDVVLNYIETPEGKAIVESFGNYKGVNYGQSTEPSFEPVAGSDVTWIGDSYSVGAGAIIMNALPGISFGPSTGDSHSYIQSNKGVSTRYCGDGSQEAFACIENPPALIVLRNIIRKGQLKRYLVMAVGTNAGWTDEEVEEFEKIMEPFPNTNVILVTAKAKVNLLADDNGTNQRLKELADKHDNYYLADWAAFSKDEYYDGDTSGTHPVSNGGYEKWVEVITDVLSSANENKCTSYVGKYPYYSQHNGPWSDKYYTGFNGSPCNIGDCGCGPSSMAMLTTVATNQDVFPDTIVDLTFPSGSYVDTGIILDKIVGERYGLEVEIFDYPGSVYPTMESAEEGIREYLRKGYMVHLSGQCEHSSTCPFSANGHYVGIFDIHGDDMVMVADSGWENAEYRLTDVVRGMHYGFSVIRGKGGNKSPCANYCTDEESTGIDEGLTVDQAQKLADFYNSNQVDSFLYGLPFGKMNCVSFSAFFVQHFTDVGIIGYSNWTDDSSGARSTVMTLGSQYGFQTGNEPKPYSIFSVVTGITSCGSMKCGHTGVVVGKAEEEEEGGEEKYIVVEAAFNASPAHVSIYRKSQLMVSIGDPFAYATSRNFNKEEMLRIVGGNI